MQYTQRVIDVLDAFIGVDSELGISEISRRLGYSKSVIHRLLTALEEAGYIASNPETRRYRLGFKAIQLGLAAQNQSEVRRVAYHPMERLCEATKETVTLSVLSGDRRTYLEVVPSPQEIRQMVELGHSQPLYLGGSGKSILAFMRIEDQERILQKARADTYSDGTPIDIDALREDLKIIRERGYAVSHSERIAGAAAVAAPIFNYSDNVIGCISVAGPYNRLTEVALEEFAPLVVDVAKEISLALGYTSTQPSLQAVV